MNYDDYKPLPFFLLVLFCLMAFGLTFILMRTFDLSVQSSMFAGAIMSGITFLIHKK